MRITENNSGSERYGMTQEEIAKRLGISRERVSQIERRAINKMLIAAITNTTFTELLENG